MKPYKTILDSHPSIPVIRHEWGQTPTTILNLIQDASLPVFLLTRKKFGFPGLRKALDGAGVQYSILGKGEEGIRLLLIEHIEAPLIKGSGKEIIFSFQDRTYRAVVDEAIFSKQGLDPGTHFLLTCIQSTYSFSNTSQVTDLGCGWGAISLVLKTEHPSISVCAIEKEPGAAAAARKNLTPLGIRVEEADVLALPESLQSRITQTQNLVIANPPFHVSEQDRESFMRVAHRCLAPQGIYAFVCEGSFRERFTELAKFIFSRIDIHDQDRYRVIIATR